MAIQRTEISKIAQQFALDVEEGLQASQPYLPSRYFYDETGDQLFQQIMQLPEYYLTSCEYGIFQSLGAEIFARTGFNKKPFELVEFGAGDGYKTKVLLRQFLKAGAQIAYIPIDISADVLSALEASMHIEFPELSVQTINDEYFGALEQLQMHSKQPKLVLFIGSNIGNFTEERTHSFLKGLHKRLNPGDQLLLGYDLRKDPRVVLQAYNDSQGVTAQFNLNLLRRINRELGSNFDINQWAHYPTYDPTTGFARSYLVSTRAQEVFIAALAKTYFFDEGACVHTEISRKYSARQMEHLLEANGFTVKQHFKDEKGWYANTLAERSSHENL